MKPTINSNKHYVHFSAFNIAGSAIVNNVIVSVDDALPSAGSVRQGAIVKAIYLELWWDADLEGKTGAVSFQKIPAGGLSPTFAQHANMGTYQNKKNVLEFHQGLGPATGNVVPMFRHWIKIPKGKQRMGLGDVVNFSISAIGTEFHGCGFATFKSYY